MILKLFQLDKVDTNNNYILFYGNNEGQKKEEIDRFIKKNNEKKVLQYDINEILNNTENFISEILNQSLFEKSKFIIINRATDKILPIIEKINSKNPSDLFIIVNANSLEKRSKLRLHLEKQKQCICVAFYPDSADILVKLTMGFMKCNDLSLSRENINLLVRKSNGDRDHLKGELEKIKQFSKNKKITNSQLMKLINLSQNHEISDLVNNCLSKNKNNLINMLNENLITNDDSVVMVRVFLNKSKRLLKLISNYQINKNLNELVDYSKPPIFWKEKEIIKKQITSWSLKDIKKLIYDLNDLELMIKKNTSNSLNFLMDFILEKSSN